jgi:hypothetical protein
MNAEYFPNIYYHTSNQGAKINGPSVALTSYILMSAMCVLRN